jgi:hypothetical protein
MDITKWGRTEFLNNYTEAIVYKKNSKGEYHVKIKERNLDVEYKIKNKLLLSFKDELTDTNNLDTFVRTFKNKIYNYKDGELILSRKKYEVPKLKPTKNH